MPPLTAAQRILTTEFINKKRLNAPFIWLRPESATPGDELECDPNQWGDTDRNAGVRLCDGYIALKITSPDDVWFKHFAPLVDARAAYGLSKRPVSSVILKIEDERTIDRWANLWPAPHKDKAGHWVKTELIYTPPAAKPDWRHSAPLPGSRFVDDLVVWRPKGKPATDDAELGLEDLEARSIEPTTMETVVRSIAFATLGYWVADYLDGLTDWPESLTGILGGWIARLVREGKDINARGKSLEGVCWSPIDSLDNASDLIRFLEGMGAGKALGAAFHRAEIAYEHDSRRVPGWKAIQGLFKLDGMIGIRRAFRAGLDIDVIEQMSERYVYDRSTQDYLDRERLHQGLSFEFSNDHLLERHQTEVVYVGKKPHNPFKIYSASGLRTDVDHREFRPGYEPGAILRQSRVHGLLAGDEEQRSDEYKLFNTFPGFAIKPIATIDQAVMREVAAMVDWIFGLLTGGAKPNQVKWLKQFVAWIAQHPEIKPQVCPVIVGGQGIGKSIFGGKFMVALFDRMAGMADASSLVDNKFMVEPFIGKLVTFIDEVKLESVGAINTIKRLIRSEYISSARKFGHQHDFYIPSRLIIASNSVEIGLSPTDAADRTLFFIMGHTAESMGVTDQEFQLWANSLKPEYAKFSAYLDKVVFRQHLMRYFMDIEVTQIELESLEHSSRDDERVVRSTMSPARNVARKIAADARVMSGLDIIAPFNIFALRDAIKRHEGQRTRIEAADVLEEYKRAQVIEPMMGDSWRFKYKYLTLLEKLGAAHGLPLQPAWMAVRPNDEGVNDVVPGFKGFPDWRGNRQQRQRQESSRPYDPDYMPPDVEY
jgi:hypothetical protein